MGGQRALRHRVATDEAAAALGLDAFALRRANLLEAPHRTLNDLQVNSYGLPQCLEAVERASGWRQRRGKLPPASASAWPARTT
jgi:4-hydroxybenzoyl-CoA reductase subunit alpha